MTSTEHPVTPTAKTGLFAALRGSLHGLGSGALSTRRRLTFATACASLIAGAAFLASSVIPAGASEPETCPNEARREEQGKPGRALPDCRAYEMVSSPQGPEPMIWTGSSSGNEHQGGAGTNGHAFDARASVTGDRFAFYTRYGAPPGSPSAGPYYLSTRSSSGWSQQNMIPPQSTGIGVFCGAAINAAYWSSDLSKGVLADGLGQHYEKYKDEHQYRLCGHDEPLLVPGEPQGIQNIFLRDSEAGSYRLLDLNQPEVPRNAWFQAGSADFSHIVFTSAAKLTPEAPTPPEYGASFYSTGEDLYVNFGGVVRLVTILPDGGPVWGLLANGGEGAQDSNSVYTRAVSVDGERVFFYAEGVLVERSSYTGGNLYLRENAAQEQSAISAGECTEPAKACTVQIDLAQSGAPGPGGGGIFQWASADGSKVFFTDESKLTADSTAEAGQPDLYEYDLEAPEGQRLTDLTLNATEPANVQGLSGVSEDGFYVYLVANGVLTGTEQNSQGAEAEAGQPNLYLRHAGVTTFIATLLPGPENDSCDWESATPLGAFVDHCMTARVSPNGAFLAFDSLKSLTGYDNTPVEQPTEFNCAGERAPPGPCQEIFLYEAAHDELSCVSCDPSGAPPIFPAGIRRPESSAGWSAAPAYLQRQLSDNGQVFFDTQNRLVSSDVNGNTSDAYEYQADHLHLISSGASSIASYFYDASPSGNDVFLITEQALVGSDTDATNSLYDARVNGGFPEPPILPECEGEGCHGPPSTAPVSTTSGSSHFEGPEEGPNHPQGAKCKKGFVRRHGHCIKPHHHKKHKRSHRRVGLSRGGAK